MMEYVDDDLELLLCIPSRKRHVRKAHRCDFRRNYAKSRRTALAVV